MEDLTGKQFNNWKVLGYMGEQKWLCECQCDRHTQRQVHRYSLISGSSKSCGKCNKPDIKVGDKFGEWTVLELVPVRKALCQCSCGKKKEVSIYSLKDGRSTGCGHTKNKDRVIDMTGQQYGDLTPIKYLDEGKWLCRCSCGRLKVAKRAKLLAGITHSCGHDRDRGFVNIRGQRFGRLTAIEYVGNKMWKCQCDCEPNKFKIIRGANLRNGSTKSCGCLQNSFTKEEILDKINQFEQENGRKPFTNDLAYILNVSIGVAQYNISKYDLRPYLNNSFSSSYEREIAEMFPNAILGARSIIPPYELDIYIPEKKLAIEFNGTYWHSDIHKDKYYHQQKAAACARRGIHLIHIFEYEWVNENTRNKLIKLIKSDEIHKERIYARETYIQKIDKQQCSEFLNKYHLQGYTASSIMIGCFSKKDQSLIGVITFGQPRFNKEYDYEIVRLAWRDNVKVVGGAEKLFSYFVKAYNPKSVLTYVDISKFKGEVYDRLGFKAAKNPLTEPNYVWVDDHNKEVLSRYKTQKKKLIKMGLGTPDQTEDEIMRNLGYLKVYDAGNLKLEWTAE